MSGAEQAFGNFATFSDLRKTPNDSSVYVLILIYNINSIYSCWRKAVQHFLGFTTFNEQLWWTRFHNYKVLGSLITGFGQDASPGSDSRIQCDKKALVTVAYAWLQGHIHNSVTFEGVCEVDATGKSFAMVHLFQWQIAYDFVLNCVL